MSILTWLILLFISWLAATISGIAGFGGSLIILPAFSFLIGAKKAIPILTIAWMMGNFSRACFGYREISWKPVIYFCLGAIPAAIIGARVFVELPSGLIMKAIAAFLFIMVVLRRSNIKYTIPEKIFIPFGALVGFLSSIFGSAGPIGAVAFLSLNLAPGAYVASEAVTAVAMHVTKTIVYGKYALLTASDVLIGMVLGAAMVAGSWTAKRFIKKMTGNVFGYFVDALLIIAAFSLLFAKN
ncbi:MAG: sulfite exporter TauE/SafE family protein [Candidatus Omnitrophica bacterium]|nr:sulfite exporter TauE/SafE family protein [Candidatus Omnitrophota bacterium]